jgi:endoglycosylceramidase
VVALLVGATVPAATAAPAPSPRPTRLLALHATHGADAAIVDAADRQVLLRGTNLNSLGDYYQDDPKLPPVVPVTNRDWKTMARQGFDVVRLLISWSKLEPRRGHYDRGYLRRIRVEVERARAQGIYTVIDMHQDAWGKSIATPAGVTCPAGTEPAIGWDGAPAWATITDGASTCRPGDRESAPAVATAWDSFYANRAGIRDHLVAAWSRVAREFRRDAAVAGYDLLNEPNHGDADAYRSGLGAFYADAIRAIRAAETGPGAFHHIVFFEPTVLAQPPATGFTDDTNVVIAPHHYGESIVDVPIDGLFDYYQQLADEFGAPLWIGEYGWFSEPAVNAEKLARYAAKEDQLITAGDAWWQWRQACGDPHSISTPGGTPDRIQIHLQRNRCPGDVNLGVVPQWACLSRPYPRAAAGRLTSLRASCTDSLTLTGHTDAPGSLDVWFPGRDRPRPGPSTNVTAVRLRPVPGGFRATARVTGDYTFALTT